ncbi:DUF1672 domain-containing protein [Bacillus aquiflavi]|uniref:DUF1672 domain-containing protein n=1 Tax=Bacillus aquiflavi TaxID=2672567 RepID=UPI00223B1856|nr:DUF1672 domain-containing protein [Bacillus aquiflavi]
MDKAVKKFFLDNYKTEVIVHNVVGAVDGASVFVESVGEPHFYTYAIVPIDIDEEKVLTDQVWSQEGQVEDSIAGALYAMIFDEEIATLDHYLQTFVNNHPVIGKRIDAIANVGANGYSTPYYYINTIDEAFDSLFKTYIQNPNLSKDEWKKQLTRNDFDPKGIILTIQLYMKEPNIEPNKAIFDQIVSDIENMDGLPRGSYTVILNDNNVDKKTAIGTKDNSLERSDPNDKIKH